MNNITEKRVLGSVGYLGRFAVHEDFMWCWGQLIQYTNEYMLDPRKELVHWMRGNTSGQYFTRNHFAANMIGDWLLMLDSDHTFEPDILHRMLKIFNERDLDVLTAQYQYKRYPYQPVLYQYFQDVERYRHIIGASNSGERAFKVDCAGGGTLLIRRRVFDRLRRELGGKPFDPTPPWGEDFSFFERLRTLGIQSYCCSNVYSYHLRTEETRPEEFDRSSVTLLSTTEVPAVL